MSTPKKLLVLGIGNSLLTDDGVGVFAAEALQKETWPPEVTIMEGGTFTQDIFYLFEGYDRLLVLDVIHGGHEPGTLYTLTENDLVSNESQRISIHDIDMLDSLKMCELKNGSRPRMEILGMEPQDITTWNIGLSVPCQERFDTFLELARKEIARIVSEMRNNP
ncbi:NiFeSe hydrogenase maturation protease [Desulfovibrio psychrotolerans]|uniref:HybD peptidase n=1 Tax=Desulfovibrio psychrotolerans TaxID=415242 RepID=A0A7J0BXE8_9BACT|nr:NiFeSe hydrogenase maturation protease [Desulfovibrio psychrotolerans]GFM38368.1 HybD peptidase [Desulfovibrio psychrotolerans]